MQKNTTTKKLHMNNGCELSTENIWSADINIIENIKIQQQQQNPKILLQFVLCWQNYFWFIFKIQQNMIINIDCYCLFIVFVLDECVSYLKNYLFNKKVFIYYFLIIFCYVQMTNTLFFRLFQVSFCNGLCFLMLFFYLFAATLLCTHTLKFYYFHFVFTTSFSEKSLIVIHIAIETIL